MSWEEFQTYWKSKNPGSWKFDDLEEKKDPGMLKIY